MHSKKGTEMTDHTDEVVKLFHQAGGQYVNLGTAPEVDVMRYQCRYSELRAFAHALRQQDLARMARMREALAAIVAKHDAFCDEYLQPKTMPEIITAKAALSETSDIQEWMDGQRVQSDMLFRSRTADLLHLLQFAEITCPSGGDKTEADKAMNDLRAMIDAPSARSTKGEGL